MRTAGLTGSRAAGGPAPQAAAEAPRQRDRALRILFVCTGNTCRSPLAEWIARQETASRGLHTTEVRSAGTHAFPGDGAAHMAELVATERGVDVPQHRSTPLTAESVRWADLVVGMAPGHLAAAAALDPSRTLALATDFLPDDHPERGHPVTDPLGGGRALYERTFDLLASCVRGLLDRLAPGSAPPHAG